MTENSADGLVENAGDGRWAIRFDRRLAHPVDRVWAALTEPERLRGWWGAAERLELTVGGAVVLRWLNTDTDGNEAVLHGTVTRCEPPHLLEYDTDLHGVLRFELRPDGEGTALTFRSTTVVPADQLPLVLAGWHLHLEFLAGALAGEPADLAHLPMDRWQRLHDEYEARLIAAGRP